MLDVFLIFAFCGLVLVLCRFLAKFSSSKGRFCEKFSGANFCFCFLFWSVCFWYGFAYGFFAYFFAISPRSALEKFASSKGRFLRKIFGSELLFLLLFGPLCFLIGFCLWFSPIFSQFRPGSALEKFASCQVLFFVLFSLS